MFRYCNACPRLVKAGPRTLSRSMQVDIKRLFIGGNPELAILHECIDDRIGHDFINQAADALAPALFYPMVPGIAAGDHRANVSFGKVSDLIKRALGFNRLCIAGMLDKIAYKGDAERA